MRSSSTLCYLARLGMAGRAEPSLETLVDLHHRHLDTVPYDNLSIMLAQITGAEPDPVDPSVTLERVAAGGNAGYCFHHNGLVALVLEELGYDVVRRPGSLLEGPGSTGTLDHLALEVRGLPTPGNPGGRWWPDLGFGDGFRDPLPVLEGHYRQDGFVYRIARAGDHGWTFHHDPRGSFAGNLIGDRVGGDEIEAAHRRLSTPPDGGFTRKLVVQRRDRTGAETLRTIVWRRIGTGAGERTLHDYDEWRAALTGLSLTLAAVDDSDLRELHKRQSAAYDDWQASL